jgi:DNA-directed RNA polymerase specialized sigma24 family protein
MSRLSRGRERLRQLLMDEEIDAKVVKLKVIK